MRRPLPALVLLAFSLTLRGAGTDEEARRPRPRPDSPGEAEREEGGPDRAGSWWEVQRAFPSARIPRGAFARGRATIRAMRRKKLRVPGPPGPPPPPWTLIGPAPLDTSAGVLETNNMSPAAGRASAVAVDPTDSKTIYAGYGLGGVWKTTDGGATWTPLGEPTLAVGSLAIDPASPQTIYVGTGEPAPYLGYSGEGIFKSTDGGQSFTKIGGSTLDGLTIGRIVLDPAGGQMFATAFYGSLGRGQICNFNVDDPAQGLYRSADGGATWTRILAGQVTDLEIDTSATPHRLLAGTFKGGASLSEDGGATWTAPTGLPATPSRVELAIAPSNPSIVYAGLGDGSTSTVWVSTDGGKSFAAMPGAPDYCESQCYYDNAVAVDPHDEKTVYVGGNLCGVWKTANGTDASPTWTNVSLPGNDCGGGNNWANGYVHPDVHGITFDPLAPGTVYAATDGGLARTTDGGATWAQVNAGVSTLQLYAICADPRSDLTLYGGAQDNGGFSRPATGLTWKGIIAGDGGPCAVDAQNSKLVLGSATNAEVYRTSNGFKGTPSFVFETDPSICQSGEPGCGDRSTFIAPLVSDPSTAGTFYVGTYRVYRTTDGGTSWKAISDDLSAGSASVKCPDASAFPDLDDALTVIAVAPSAPGTLYTGSQAGRIYMTMDGGKSWARADKAPLPGRWVSGLAVDPRDPRTVFASFSGFDAATPGAPGHVFRSSDGGKTWEIRDIGADVPVDALLAHPVGSDLLYAGTDAGVLVTTDGGKTWVPFDDGLPEVPVYSLVYQRAAGAIVAGTFGRSAWSRAFTAGALSVTPVKLAFTVEQGAPAPAAQAIGVTNGDAYGSIASFTVAAGAPWISVDTSAGDAAGATAAPIHVSVDPSQLGAGEVSSAVTVTPKGGGAAVTIPVTLTVTAPPAPMAPAKKGCGCRAAGSDEGTGWWIVGLFAAAVAARRKRIAPRGVVRRRHHRGPDA